MNRNKGKVYFRDYKNFNSEAYLSDINSFDWNNIVLSPDMYLSKKTEKVIDALKSINDKYAPLRIASK